MCTGIQFHLLQDIWPAPAGTPAKELTNVSLNIAHAEFMEWTRANKIEHHAAHMCTCVHSSNSCSLLHVDHSNKKIARHSQPEFHARNLRDSVSGYAEMSMKAHNAPRFAQGFGFRDYMLIYVQHTMF